MVLVTSTRLYFYFWSYSGDSVQSKLRFSLYKPHGWVAFPKCRYTIYIAIMPVWRFVYLNWIVHIRRGHLMVRLGWTGVYYSTRPQNLIENFVYLLKVLKYRVRYIEKRRIGRLWGKRRKLSDTLRDSFEYRWW